ncbi:endo-beta-1,6-glucanase [Phlyctema vagabunda]|uniref:Endo-beta-1,6-glucanase n=1 Tax=Phlyctema vagabunda TaxID=108571 RepID=A0ABR4PXC5_9HELO
MKKLLSKAKAALQDEFPQLQQSQQSQRQLHASHPSTIGPPKPIDVLRYRYHHGTNLGSIFVLEDWLFPSMYPPETGGSSELDAVYNSIHRDGLEASRNKWEQHWRDALTDADLEWLVAEARCTSIRLPIGYFTLGDEFSRGTPYEGAQGVYVNAWKAVRDLVSRARNYGIGVLLDFHALPGGANSESHSGTNSGHAGLWGDGKNLDLATRCIAFMAREIRENGMDGIIGLQLVNESPWDAKGMYEWYEHVIAQISYIDDSIPIYVSDGWDLGRALSWANGRKVLHSPRNPVVVDTHKYYTFSDSDRNQAPHEIIGRINGELTELDGKNGSLWDRGEAEIIIGEWSCVLDTKTWERVQAEEKDGLVKQFGNEQSRKWQERAGGSFFWTYKMDWMDGNEWGFSEQTKKHNIAAPPNSWLPHGEIQNRAQVAQARREELRVGAQGAHEAYWNQTCPGEYFEHHVYSEGWNTGFSDAQAFFTMRVSGGLGQKASEIAGADKIGCLEIWIKKRLLESGHTGPFTWMWEQGLRSGVKAFYEYTGI